MKSIEQKLQANISKLYIMNAAWMFLVLMPVVVPFFQGYGLNMERIYILITIFSTSVVILEVPSGYVSDLLGRKQTLVAAGLFLGLCFSILAVSTSFKAFIVFELLHAVAISLFSGTDVALIYDSMANLQEKKWSETTILGRKIFYSQIGETIAALLGGALVAVSLSLPATINAITAWLPFFVALTLYEPARRKMDSSHHLKNFHKIYRVLFRESKLLRQIILTYISLGLASYIVIWAFQGFWKEIGVPLHFFGYLWAAYNLTVAFTGRIAHKVELKLGSVRTLLLMGLLPVVGFFSMAALGSIAGIILGLSLKVCRGLNQVVTRDALNARVGGEMRATANSIASLGVRLLFACLGPFMGFLIDSKGYPVTFSILGILYIVLFFVLVLPLTFQHKLFRPVRISN